ncbi:MAG: DNA polymerase III subunit gamma/tau, partial [Novosphingobium meiothermophilum]
VAQVGGIGPDVRSSEERETLEKWAGTLSAGQLHRLWQLLLKGYEEVKIAPDPLVAAQMALLRVMHAADLPDPGGLVKKLEELAQRPALAAPAAGHSHGADSGAPEAGHAAPQAAPSAARVSADWEALVEQVEQHAPLVGSTMRLGVRVVELRTGLLRYQLAPGL